MGKYILESKQSHFQFKHAPIKVKAYMVFKDSEAADKSIVLKMENNTDAVVQGFQIEIRQINAYGNAIDKADYAFDNVNADPMKTFVPDGKIKTSSSCTKVECDIIKVQTNSDTWTKDGWLNVQVEDTTSKQKTTPNIPSFTHSYMIFPYFITLTILVVFILLVVFVFNAIQY